MGIDSQPESTYFCDTIRELNKKCWKKDYNTQAVP